MRFGRHYIDRIPADVSVTWGGSGDMLAQEQQVTERVVPTSKAIEELIDHAYEVYNRLFRRCH
jgi:hypothetical protein